MPKELQSDLSVRKIQFNIGGQHENEFDPDYLIYNVVILQVERTPELLQLNEQEQIPSSIIGYPREDFEPINYHTSTLVSIKNNNDGDENDLSTFKIITIGNEGYRNGIDREFNSNRDDYECPVYSLDVLTFRMQRIQTSSSSSSSSSFSSKENQSPGLISGQRAKYIEEEDMIYVGSEKVLELLLPNILFNDGKNHQSNEKNSNDDDNSEVRTPRWAKRKELKTSNFVKRRVIENDTIEVEDSVYYTLCVKTWQWTKHCFCEPSARSSSSSSSSSSSVPISIVTHDDSDVEVKYLRKRGADVSLEQLSPVRSVRPLLLKT
jgi:hypothetical protein